MHSTASRPVTSGDLTNAVVMPFVLRLNRVATETRVKRLAAWLQSREAEFDRFQRLVLYVRAEIGIPHGFKPIGGTDDRGGDTLIRNQPV